MRLTVGPLPPAVYWRRRAIVLGALLFVLFLLVYKCGGTDPSGAADKKTGSGSTASPSSTVLAPVETASAQPTASAPASARATGPCTDAEVVVTISTEGGKTEFVQGTYVKIYLKIKNISTRTCSRDLGATAQELRIAQGAAKMWSSDDCVQSSGSDVRALRAGEQVDQFNVMWNGRESTNCQTKPLPPPGTYQVLGRFGTRWSDPIPLIVKPGK
ncbi:MAG TPA: hypothetical protein VFE14_17695 [Micromonosporaceae bacterium]|jgi:hypothetical protein|nr:hypothetical protein [Micromonosporaceae bacterium]